MRKFQAKSAEKVEVSIDDKVFIMTLPSMRLQRQYMEKFDQAQKSGEMDQFQVTWDFVLDLVEQDKREDFEAALDTLSQDEFLRFCDMLTLKKK